MDSLSEQTISGLTKKEIEQLAKRCPIVLCVTEDVQLDRFEYTDVLESNNDEFLSDLKIDLEDARVSWNFLFDLIIINLKFAYIRTL